MVDAHYDLLSICYTCYLKNNYAKIKNIVEEIKQSGVSNIFANLYFMSPKEMMEELDYNYYNKNISVLEMFKISKQILEYYLPEINFIYSIEGCDYIEEKDLEELCNEGLRSIILVWNTENRYGSGNRTNKGLTIDGISFINKAIELGIGIDLSHANEKTFYGLIEVIKENQRNGRDVICYASHSNSRELCNRERNLTDKQLESIKEVGGLVGVFSNRKFISKDILESKDSQKISYLRHIIHISNIIGVDNIIISTDDMRFCEDVDPEYGELPIFDYSEISSQIEKLLLTSFNQKETNNILYDNVYKKIINKLNEKTNMKTK